MNSALERPYKTRDTKAKRYKEKPHRDGQSHRHRRQASEGLAEPPLTRDTRLPIVATTSGFFYKDEQLLP